MALNPALLAQPLISAAGTRSDDPAGIAAWTAVAQVIVLHIQANAQVVVTGTATGVTAGPAAVPVVGTGTVL